MSGKPGRSLFGIGARPAAAVTPIASSRAGAPAAPSQDLQGLNIRALAGAAVLAAAQPAAAPAVPALQIAPLVSRPVRYRDIGSPWLAYWAQALRCAVRPHRKLWEYAAVLQGLYEAGVIVPGAKMLAFGAAGEPMPSYLASLGASIVATDLPEMTEDDSMLVSQLVDAALFERTVEVSNLDIRRLDDPTLRGFDACWSCSVLTSLPSMDQAMEAAIGVMDVLRPGGVAVHTLEFAFADDMVTEGGVVFTRRALERLADGLNGRGHKVTPLDFGLGDHPLDGYVDAVPFEVDGADAWRALWSDGLGAPHLKISEEGVMKTSFVLMVTARA